jgi:thiol-disulfide isomerase/thioredoxin
MSKSLAIAGATIALFTVSIAAAEPTGRVAGRVTVEQTGAPVAGARVMALTGMSEDRPGRQFAHTEVRTNENGEYLLQVPIGNVQLFPPEPPVGYWIGSKPFHPFDELVVTRNEPTVRCDFQVKPAAIWNAKVSTSAGRPVTNVETYIFRDTDIAQAKAAVNDEGEGHFTTPTDGGKLSLGIIDMHLHFFSPQRVAVDIAPDFDPSTAKISAAELDKPIELVDRAGRKATIDGALVVMQNGVPQIQLVADTLGQESLGELRGLVTDANAQPIKDARVMLIGSLPPPADLCHTDDQGRFQFRGPIKWMPEKSQPSTYQLIVLKDGFVELRTKEDAFKPDNNGVQQLDKPLVLKPGYSAPLRILDVDGNPVEGAWIEPGDGLADSAQFTKTDQNGNCVVRNLPAGITRLQLRYGDQWASDKIVVSASSATEPAVNVRLVKKPSENAKPEPFEPKPVKVKTGEMAPQWSIAQWTDGKDHQLSDFRGQVVVIDFWGVWCSACINEIPAIKNLQDKFADRVVFVGIHTAGGDMNQAKKLLELKEWNVLVGIDRGPEIVKGETVERYGIRGFPTNIVVDKQGRIAFRSDVNLGDEKKVMAEAKSLAEELKIPWPIDKDVSEEETIARVQRMGERRLAKEIEKALAK